MRSIAISGVNRGLGEGIARFFAQEGWLVHGLGRSAPAWPEDIAERLIFHACDMADAQAVVAACRAIDGPLDVVICNAAVFGNLAYHLHEFDPTEFAHTFAVNCIAPALMARELHARLLQGTDRKLIMMSTGNASLAGNISGGMMAYRASKSALNQMVRNYAAEWGPEGLVTVALNPGWIRTQMGGAGAPTEVDEAAADIFRFITEICDHQCNGAFVNLDGSPLPW